MFDILGPANAEGAVTTRPDDDRTFGALDTWFEDCTSIDAGDGTDVRAAFFNGVLAVLRGLYRINGNRLDGVTPINGVEDRDNGLNRAVYNLVQRGKTNYAPDTGSTNAIVLNMWVPPIELIAGLPLRTKLANAITGAATVTIVGVGTVPLKNRDGSDLVAGVYGAGSVVDMIYDGTKLVVQNNLNASGKAPGGFIKRRVFSTVGSTPYDPTPGTSYIVVTVLGGGGGGGGSPAMGGSSFGVAGGGGAGGVAISQIASGFSGAVITVGGGGGGGAGVGGATGGTSSFGAFCSATGGGGGASPDNISIASMQTGGAGGAGTGGNIYISNGSSGVYGTALSAVNLVSGPGASSPVTGGGGGNSVFISGGGSNGNHATSFGAGGGGASAGNSAPSHSGGNGGQGVIYIDEYA
ncbi:hypothetical protein LPW26_06140 [Rhodopseudomonas sp. HC1]|uniref:glycine-rich domain-containing protein n=1 Tax=Rhodopseudomonas infernalis TaxID=2897386 RepID=UPI001EE8AE22|nr:hypothetical protein [Rhodopseudomonas infernalis]MCG6204207.1 hypothetical protein [Rhodopseudomonas infernalis]